MGEQEQNTDPGVDFQDFIVGHRRVQVTKRVMLEGQVQNSNPGAEIQEDRLGNRKRAERHPGI